jgi:flagellar biosynthetic protein FliQ
MTPEIIMSIGHQAIEVTVLISGPMLITALCIGLIVSIFQAATQINETTLSFIPKLLGIFVVLIILGPWMLTILTDYLSRILTDIASYSN